MAQSTEFPQLALVRPRSYSDNRDGKSVCYAVIHYTAGSEGPTSAEDGAAYDARRTDGTSTHFFCDSNSTVQCVYTWERANSCFSKCNRLGVQFELCGTAQSREQWLDPTSLATLQQAAYWVAQVCKKYGLPVRRLSQSETRAAWYSYPKGPKGIIGHVDATLAYPEDGGTHTDPGDSFPWNEFLEMVRAHMTKEVEMFMAQVTGDPAVYVSNGFTYRHITPDAFAKYQAMAVPSVAVGSKVELTNLCGVEWAVGAGVKLDQASLDAVEAAAEAGAQQGSSGASAAEVEEIVDRNIDEAFGKASEA